MNWNWLKITGVGWSKRVYSTDIFLILRHHIAGEFSLNLLTESVDIEKMQMLAPPFRFFT